MCVNVCLCECVHVFSCVCDLSGNENAPRCDLHKTCTARHKLHRPAPFIYSLPAYFCYVFFPLILVYRYFRVLQVSDGWVILFSLPGYIHGLHNILNNNILVSILILVIIILCIICTYYTILLFLLGRIDIGTYYSS